MNAPRGRTIQIYLPSGEPRGIRIAEMTTRTVQAMLVPQAQLRSARTRPEFDQIAVYFLFGESDEHARPLCYIGQSEDLRSRLDRHSAQKDFWNTAVVGISKTQAFTPAHIRWLEWHSIGQAQRAGRYELANDQMPREPFVTEPLRDDCLDSFENISILLTALGYPLLEPVVQVKKQELFYISGPDAKGTGVLLDDGFQVQKGSVCRKEIVESARAKTESARSRLIESNILANHNDSQWIFTEDYLFNTPSGAANIILGRSSNGWDDWKDANGNSLHDMRRATATEEAQP